MDILAIAPLPAPVAPAVRDATAAAARDEGPSPFARELQRSRSDDAGSDTGSPAAPDTNRPPEARPQGSGRNPGPTQPTAQARQPRGNGPASATPQVTDPALTALGGLHDLHDPTDLSEPQLRRASDADPSLTGAEATSAFTPQLQAAQGPAAAPAAAGAEASGWLPEAPASAAPEAAPQPMSPDALGAAQPQPGAAAATGLALAAGDVRLPPQPAAGRDAARRSDAESTTVQATQRASIEPATDVSARRPETRSVTDTPDRRSPLSGAGDAMGRRDSLAAQADAGERPGLAASRDAGALPRSEPPPSAAAPAGFAAELSRLTGSTPARETPASAELRLATPVTAPEFVPHVGAEIALLARNGVQEARVHLHPQELGPISVQITLEGQAAQVHLAVESAQTRQILETAMPTLAGALRDAGLTLTGGGVFEQSRQGARPDDPQTGPARSGSAADAAPDAATTASAATDARRVRVRSGLDLYA